MEMPKSDGMKSTVREGGRVDGRREGGRMQRNRFPGANTHKLDRAPQQEDGDGRADGRSGKEHEEGNLQDPPSVPPYPHPSVR